GPISTTRMIPHMVCPRPSKSIRTLQTSTPTTTKARDQNLATTTTTTMTVCLGSLCRLVDRTVDRESCKRTTANLQTPTSTSATGPTTLAAPERPEKSWISSADGPSLALAMTV
ncbi:hypothetical protein LTR66_016631, partial [Elasticomyces elasticus]